MERRDLLKVCVGGATTTLVAGASLAEAADCCSGTFKKYPNSHFYKAGVFQPEVAKAAYFELFAFYNYSLADSLKDNADFWAVDFGFGDFANVGMGGIMWINDKEHSYFGHEIYLLPGQMIPEHYHLPSEGLPAKHEAWQVRHGSIFNFSQGGEKTDAVLKMLPKGQLDDNAITCFQFKELKVGDMDALRKLEEPHFMMGGPNGAIVTEFASYHSAKGLNFTNTKSSSIPD